MVNSGSDPNTGLDPTRSIQRAETFYGLTREEIDSRLFPDGLFAGTTPTGWFYFQKCDDPGGYRATGTYDKYLNRKLNQVQQAVDLTFVTLPNGHRVVTDWKRKGI
jgi:hypothetical protein